MDDSRALPVAAADLACCTPLSGTAMSAEQAERAAEHEGIARRNGERIADDPTVVLDALTRQHSTFTRQDLARFVSLTATEPARIAGLALLGACGPARRRLPA